MSTGLSKLIDIIKEFENIDLLESEMITILINDGFSRNEIEVALDMRKGNTKVPLASLLTNVVNSNTNTSLSASINSLQNASKISLRGSISLDGWIVQPDNVTAEKFARDNLPSSWCHKSSILSWICLNSPGVDVDAVTNLDICDGKHPVGKWMLFIPPQKVDDAFIKLAKSLDKSELGFSLKVSVDFSRAVVLFCIYTWDFRDETDVLRVGLKLRELGFYVNETLSYKPDIFTLNENGIYGANTLPKSIYHLKKNEINLFHTRDSKDFKITGRTHKHIALEILTKN